MKSLEEIYENLAERRAFDLFGTITKIKEELKIQDDWIKVYKDDMKLSTPEYTKHEESINDSKLIKKSLHVALKALNKLTSFYDY